ncbi:hypothetical protein [Kordia sp.]|uniref:hypothetical protein n=1 Tax=Kordia sp. TaxID=1965332 RepID=UPI0025BA047D|nr:hypothetical protein [Kordia sp.]MCH2196072.1 hypothetical protein [Kordia sp.]
MRLLSILTPAETELILENRTASFKDLMKLTFMDLLLKKVIKIVEVEKQSHPRNDSRVYTYIEKGKNFANCKPNPHESIYTTPFEEEDDIQILFHHFVKIGYEATGKSIGYKKKVKKTGNLDAFLKSSFFLNLFGMIRLNKQGEKTKKEISNYLKEVDSKINHLLENDKEKALEILLTIGGNIFLLKNLNFELLKNIDKQLLAQKRSESNSESDDYGYWNLHMDFYEHNDLFSDDFDNGTSFQSYLDDTLDSFDTQFDASGCSVFDSGCSSCSGCGGCGGCS